MSYDERKTTRTTTTGTGREERENMGLSGREQGKEPRSINTTWVTYQNEKSTRKRNSKRRVAYWKSYSFQSKTPKYRLEQSTSSKRVQLSNH